MKKMILTVVVLVLILMPVRAWAMPGDKFTAAWTVNVEPLGDAKIAIKFKYDAQTYAIWQRKYGLNPSLLRRDLGKFLRAYEIPDKSFVVDDSNKMEREITVSLLAKGYMTCKPGDIWETWFPKKYQRGDRVENHYSFFGSSKLDDGRVMEETVQLVLPKSASDFKERTNEKGDTVIQYQLPIGGGGVISGGGLLGVPRIAWFGAAGLFAFVGFILMVAGLVIRGKRPVPVTA